MTIDDAGVVHFGPEEEFFGLLLLVEEALGGDKLGTLTRAIAAAAERKAVINGKLDEMTMDAARMAYGVHCLHARLDELEQEFPSRSEE